LTWSKVKLGTKSARPAARSYATLTGVGEHIVLFGGNNKTRSFNDVYIGTAESRKDGTMSISWTEAVVLGGAAPAARTGHVATISSCGSGVVIAGGWDDLGARRLFHSDAWELVVENRVECRWRQVHAGCGAAVPMGQPGARAGASLCDAQVGAGASQTIGAAVLHGGFRGATYFDDCYSLKA
jgi:hypothetical protein